MSASPLIFILALEPLACAIRTQKEIKGISIASYEFKLNLFADDILLTITNLEKSIPKLLQLIEVFGSISGYKVNYTKSEAIPLNRHTFQSHLGTTTFQWKPEGMTYLGIKIKHPIETMVELNIKDLTKTLREDLKHWTILPLSLWGRAETIKMYLLPKLNFIIASIPLKFPTKWFKDINKLFTAFLWRNKKPRISYKKFIQSRNKGEIGLPDLYLYYIAFNSIYPLKWAYSKLRETGSWEWLEEKIVKEHNPDLSLATLWYSPKTTNNINSPLIPFSGDIIKMLHKYFRFNGKSLPSCPLWSNPLFMAGKRILKNKVWQQNNIQNISQLIINGKNIIAFSDLKKEYRINDAEMFNYLQIKSILKSSISQDNSLGDKKDLEDKLKRAATNRGTVSVIYRLLCSTKSDHTYVTKNQWIKDIGGPISNSQWSTALQKRTKMSKCAKYKTIQLKIINRAYITPFILNKMDEENSKLCWHGCGLEGTLLHMLWKCPSVQTFWRNITDALSHMFDVQISPCPLDCLLGIRTQDFKSKDVDNIISLGFLAAKCIIMLNWKKREYESFDVQNWNKDFLELIAMEQAALLLDNQSDSRLVGPWPTVKMYLQKCTQ